MVSREVVGEGGAVWVAGRGLPFVGVAMNLGPLESRGGRRRNRSGGARGQSRPRRAARYRAAPAARARRILVVRDRQALRKCAHPVVAPAQRRDPRAFRSHTRRRRAPARSRSQSGTRGISATIVVPGGCPRNDHPRVVAMAAGKIGAGHPDVARERYSTVYAARSATTSASGQVQLTAARPRRTFMA